MHLLKARWWAQDYLWAGLTWLSTFWAPSSPEGYAEGPGRIVVALPGVYENWRFLRPLIVPLHQAGNAVHTVPALGYNRAPIASGAHALLRLLHERDLSGVVLVAHSKGGLLGKLAMMADPERRIDAMVTLATPFHGSSRSRLLPLPSIRPLAPGHSSLSGLGDPHPVNARITSIAGSFDEHVPEGSELPGARNLRLKVPGHFRLLGHPDVVAAVLAAVEDAPSVRDTSR